jgi:hypothetical protein
MNETPKNIADKNTDEAEEQILQNPIQPVDYSKRKSTKWVTFGILILLVIVVVNAFLLLSMEKSADDYSNKVSEQQETSEISKLEIINDTESQNLGSVLFYAESTKRYVALEADSRSSVSAKLVKKDLILSIDYSQLYDEFVDLYFVGYSKVDAFDRNEYLAVSNAIYERFENESSACTINLTWPEDFEGNSDSASVNAGTVQILCAYNDKINDVAEFMEQFYVAYYKANSQEESQDSDSNLLIMLDESSIEDGDSPGYQIVRGGLGYVMPSGGSSIVFARQTGGVWEFVLTQQDVAPCSWYKTEVSIKALADTICSDGIQDSESWPTVGQYYN